VNERIRELASKIWYRGHLEEQDENIQLFAELVAAKDTELLQQLLWLCSKDGGWTLEEAANTICEIENILRARLG
jgi:hypothetical protein